MKMVFSKVLIIPFYQLTELQQFNKLREIYVPSSVIMDPFSCSQ